MHPEGGVAMPHLVSAGRCTALVAVMFVIAGGGVVGDWSGVAIFRQEPYPPDLSAYPELLPLHGDSGVALWNVASILSIIVVQSVVTQKRSYQNGEEDEAGREAMPELRSHGQRPENENVPEVWS